jgi:signal transduction histidine kinase
MDPNLEHPVIVERHQTNKDLSVERSKTNQTVLELQRQVGARADTLIEKTREIEDQKTEEKASAPLEKQLEVHEDSRERERKRVDKVIEGERAQIRREVKEIFKEERTATDASLVREREKTDEILDHASLEIESKQKALNLREYVLAMVSHDLKNPIESVLLSAQLLKDGSYETVGDLQRVVDIIGRSASTMNSIVDRLQQAIQFQSGTLAVHLNKQDVRPIVSDCVEMERPIALKKRLKLEFSSEDHGHSGSFHLEVDRTLLMQALSNLIGNAIKFTPEGGTVKVKAISNSKAVEIQVADTGPGIPDEDKRTVFQRFSQLEPGDRRGLGLGLYITQKVVSAHHGKIEVRDNEPSGSVFAIELPKVTS